ncbi:MAG: hypothetical protein HC897_11805 [Thermoanaerobaculia bacterium]|nr:hypothetical protein [Thermoanaerobaculia bacterium]
MAVPKFRGVLLCEDLEHERFFRRLLETRWFGRGKLRVLRIPNRQGAGDAFVLERYAAEVQHARSKRGERYVLVVAIDGDREKVRGRLEQLDRKLEQAGLSRRVQDEPVIVFVPTRNIETWELWLCGDHEVDEEADLKLDFRDAERRGEASAKQAVTAWFRSLSEAERQREEANLPSLAAGRREIRRLDR